MKTRTLVLSAVTLLLLLASGLLYGYLARHAMKPVNSWQRGSPSAAQRVLIATQGSSFKDQLVEVLVTRLERQQVYAKVIDVAGLADVKEGEWQAIVIIHTWEMGKPPAVVRSFVARSAEPRRIIDVTTSGSGREKLPGVDVISSASVIDDVPALAGEIEAKIGALSARQ